jgi:uncharacterized protein (DUF2147 family)
MFRRSKWPALFFRVAMFAIGLMSPPALAMRTASPVGIWSTAHGHGVVAIAQCGDALRGRIVDVDRMLAEPMQTDVLRRPQCGLTIITSQKPKADGTCLGEITDPRDGGMYQAKL